MTSKQILLLRHGETDWNVQMRFQGRKDIPLNAKGEAQAHTVSRRIREWGPEALWVSPQARALKTAQIAVSFPPERFHVVEELCEVGFGVWEGKSAPDLGGEYSSLYLQWKKSPFSVIPEKGESAAEIMERAARVLRMLADARETKCLVVAHGGILRAIVAQVLNISFESAWKLEFSNCSLSGLRLKDMGYSVAFLNDVIHQRQNETQRKEIAPLSF